MISFFTKRRVLPVTGLVATVALCGLVAVSSTASSDLNAIQELPKQETQITAPQVAVPQVDAPAIAQEFGTKRKLRLKSFGKKMPVIITSVKNLDADEETWMRDLEIEVKNVSRKPIYILSLRVEFPDVKVSDDPRIKTGFGIFYDNRSPHLRTIKDIASPSDDSIKPGETYTFKIPEGRVLGYRNAKRRDASRAEKSKNIHVRLYHISFGDGTGFIGKQYWDSRRGTPNRKAAVKKAAFKKLALSPSFEGLSFQKTRCTKTPQFAFISLSSLLDDSCGSGNCSPLIVLEDNSYQCDGGYNDEGEYVQCPFTIPAEEPQHPALSLIRIYMIAATTRMAATKPC